MNILINGSGLKLGGGLQVADSICSELYKYPYHKFVVVLSSHLRDTENKISNHRNIETYIYDCPIRTLKILLSGRDTFLDLLVEKRKIDVVLSIFGPSIWVPKCPHLSGFARAQLVMPESPYYSRMKLFPKFKSMAYNQILKFFFNRSTRYFYTENPLISRRVERFFNVNQVYTITNYYNQVFDNLRESKEHRLPPFNGFSFLSISSPYPHKNLEISIEVARYLKKKNPDFMFRFVFTIVKEDFPELPKELENHFCLIGPVNNKECPSLYDQCDVVFQPTLLECFTATYPEAMKMQKPIVTTDLEFAKSLCGDAACYYSAIDPKSAAEAIYKVATDKEYAQSLIEKGEKQLLHYDNYEQRAEKLIGILEQIGKA